LAFVFRTEGLGTGVRDALKLRAVLVIGTLGVVAAVRETRLVRAGAASAVSALLRVWARLVDAGEQALPIDTDAGFTTLEVELAQDDGRIWLGLGDQLRLGLGRV
jgi:hypothetical protein